MIIDYGKYAIIIIFCILMIVIFKRIFTNYRLQVRINDSSFALEGNKTVNSNNLEI